MTSLSSNSINPATPNPAPATPSNISASTPSQPSSGQPSSTPAAATAASRATPNPVSYAAATKRPSPPIVSSNTTPIPVSGAQGTNARPTNASPVNGKTHVAPAVPTVAGVSVVVNGAAGPPNGHSRKSSIVSGGNNAWNGITQASRQPQGSGGQIQFGSFPGNQSAQAPLGGAQISSPNLAAPALAHPHISSPQMSPSPLPQPAVSGGPIAHQGIREQGNITFGSIPSGPERVDQRQMHGNNNNNRPASMPMPPVAPAAQGQQHNRRESASSHHAEMPQGMGPNRGGMQNQGARRGGYGNQFNAQAQGFNNHNYNRGQPSNRGGAYHHQNHNNTPHYANVQGQMGGYPGSPQQRAPRSPAMHHSVPHSQPGTPQLNNSVPMQNSPSFPHASLYQAPLQHQPHFVPPPQSYDPNLGYHPGFPHMYQAPYNAVPPASPRNPYIAMGAPVGYPQYGIPQAMSRSASAAGADIRVPPSAGFAAPIPTHMPATPPANVTQAPPAPKRASKGIPIVHPETGAPLSFRPETRPRPVVSSSGGPLIVSSGPLPSPRAATTPGGKTDDEKRKSMAAQVQKKKEEDEALEREAQQKKKEEEERLKREAEEAEEKKRKEEEEKARKEAEEKARAEEERLKKEKEEEERIAREKAEEEARIAKEKAEEEARIAKEKEEEEARIAKQKAEEEARIAKEKAEEEARLAKEKEEAEKKAREEAEAKAKADAEAAEAAAAKAAEEAAASKAEAEKAAESATEQSEPPKALEDVMRPPASKAKAKPVPLVLKTSTEPGPPSAALTALRSARFIGDINSVQYPANILSPNPALNPGAPAGKFKYHKDFLLQFQEVFKDKPSQDWDQRIRDTVGDPTDSARPMTARIATNSLGQRGSRTSGTPFSTQPMAMGSFGTAGASGAKFGSGVGLPANMLTSQQRFEQSSAGTRLTTTNPLQSLVTGSFRSSGAPISRTNSSAGLSSQAGAIPSSPRTGNRSQRGSKRGPGGVPMEKTESKQAEPKPVLTIPVSEVKPLVVSEKRWQPRSVAAAASTGAAPGVASLVAPPVPTEDNKLSPELVQRKVKAALNKMTPEKFDKISQQILDIASQSKYETDGRTLRQVIQLTFEKATDEAAWSSMYAKFCKKMMENMDPNIKDESITDLKTGKVVTGGSLFRKYLLNRCQEEFQRGWKVNLPPKPEGETDEAAMLSDEYYIAAAAKRRGLGLIQFIGELFKLSMLTERIMHECVKKLVDFDGVPEEAEVESLCKLLRTIGSSLDSTEKSKPAMDQYFLRISKMIEHPDLNSRLKFMLMDIVDLRNKHWSGTEVDKGPKTIAEIREDVQKAIAEKEAKSQANAQRGGRSMGRGDGRSFSQGGYGGHSEYERQQRQQAQNTIGMEDLRKLGQNKSRNITSSGQAFGPPSMFARTGSNPGKKMGPPSFNRGGDDSGPSSRSATPASGQREAPTTVSKNSFHLLADHSGDGDANESVSPVPSAASSPPTTKATLAMKPLSGKSDQK